MSNDKIVVAIGGNAILSDNAGAEAQYAAIESIAGQLASLLENGAELTVVHGNGPQVGNLLLQQFAADSAENPAMPLDALVAMTQGSIGYWIQNALQHELAKRGVSKDVVTVVTQVEIDSADPAFQNPTKPIGPFLTEEQALEEMRLSPGTVFKEDAGRGWRRMAPSPRPVDIKEASAISKLINQGVVTIVAGGGGIPVAVKDGRLRGAEAVIDKDLAAELVAELIGADRLIFLTGVDNVYIHYNTPRQSRLEEVSTEELEEYCRQGLFAAGSMLPKIEAAMQFVRSREGRSAVITSLKKLREVSKGAGTIICGGRPCSKAADAQSAK